MTDDSLAIILGAFGKKIYELHVGFAALFNVALKNKTFELTEFHEELRRLEAEPDITKFREAVGRMAKFKDEKELEQLLKDAKFLN
jgi:hypothetical protein